MHSGMIGKIEKARRYASERERFAFQEMTVTVRGNNDSHDVTLHSGHWQCQCDFFAHNQTCAHTMALEVMLDGMLPSEAQYAAAS
ncbi:MAG: hypothetical protein GEU80_05035 [Dehalococcoidia bacterium]|nr:hypothetical protein [Dehalococcoidia bacterium]